MEIEGMVFPRLQWVGPDEPREAARDIRMAVERHRGDLRGGERSYNRVELAGLFAEYELTDREEDLLAKFLVGAWTGWLHTSFPDRCFVLELMRADETGEGLEITFYEQR
jgi:hypothetical protein